jgi:hypothetical protein
MGRAPRVTVLLEYSMRVTATHDVGNGPGRVNRLTRIPFRGSLIGCCPVPAVRGTSSSLSAWLPLATGLLSDLICRDNKGVYILNAPPPQGRKQGRLAALSCTHEAASDHAIVHCSSSSKKKQRHRRSSGLYLFGEWLVILRRRHWPFCMHIGHFLRQRAEKRYKYCFCRPIHLL